MATFIPNTQVQLCVLKLWPDDAGVEELDVIAWKLEEGEEPVPIAATGDLPDNGEDGAVQVIFNRETESREAVVKQLRKWAHARSVRAKQGAA